ncbi:MULTISPECIES: isochorismate synthase MenF [unclassified Corynebacterium]|uniref:isochorismate synthase n=1 Tax=unclassified Corynebacterium TaxID=2624378 RepID=UPI00216AA3B7|nr:MULTISPECIES: isochorismate synthase [unclassified Corynebacterium]MCS4489636.1 isochorismate synthase [Corynebacterium sp. ES2775-CONJ]MCS4531547.1 isochorismate synthase [Corynebacterium sp. ES2730-CONJ]
MRSFIFISPEENLSAHGIAQKFSTVHDGIDYLNNGGEIVLGALSFHPDRTPYLFAPDSFQFSSTTPTLTEQESLTVVSVTDSPSPSQHYESINRAIGDIKAGKVDKIVLSRAQRYRLLHEPHPEAILARYMHSAGTGYGYLSAVGNGEYFVGPSPEILLLKRGKSFISLPLAGTAPRSEDSTIDNQRAELLKNSHKDHIEHAYVTEGLREILAPLSRTLDIPRHPSLIRTTHTWHLGTRIQGELKENMTALELASLLHPTAAVNGYPKNRALEILKEREPDRGFYAGTVGWSDRHGNGEWRVAIRSALIGGRDVTAYAGGGIVADSVAAEELAETSTKLGPIRAVLNLGPEVVHPVPQGPPHQSSEKDSI